MTGSEDRGAGARLRAVAAEVGGEIGLAFLQRVATALRAAMAADLVFITVGEGRPPYRADAVIALENGAGSEVFTYDLDGTPCRFVYAGRTVVIPRALAQKFPREEGYEGYVGTPIRDPQGEVAGHFAVISMPPIAAPEAAEQIVRIFGARIEAELRHRALLSERERLIADLIAATDALKARSQALHDANQYKTQLVGMIAHDLRNPLAAIMAKAELLQTRLMRGDVDVAAAQRDIDRVIAGADRLTRLIGATLERVRQDSATLEIERRPVDLVALSRAAIAANEGEAARKGISVALLGPATLATEVDEGLCLEAVDNLVSNAIKYSPGGTRVEVRLDETPDGLRIAVVDQGQGLTELDLARAFQPFQTLSARPTGGETATGLGLANVRQVVEAHGGRVTAASAGPGHGATFTIVLPQPVDDAGRGSALRVC